MQTIALRRRLSRLTLIGLLTLFPGCGIESTTAERGAVSGYISIDGSPVESAHIIFMSEDREPVVKARGFISRGTFSIGAENGPAVGRNRIAIVPAAMELEAFEAERKGKRTAAYSPILVEIPKVYQDPESSDLEADVTPSETDNYYEFKLAPQ
ncbi:hypothetical protein [Rubinisphaera margarita]|uniref:hypothetical protein n=1 Tax=Rubinisphaera margarita TaxID=2909586 RepID=UPI001EE83CFA|nr:hypothetical protein [Rubinisphaera margarita]MCG6154561.1 hypothetical protein [Rubinisphaera margarita]